MTPDELRAKLIRNFNDAAFETSERAPLYDGVKSARLARRTAAQKMGASIDIVPPGKRACPYHSHYVEEEMFSLFEGLGTFWVSRARGRSSTVAKCTARRTISTIGTGKHDVRQLPTRSGANLASNSASRLHVRHN